VDIFSIHLNTITFETTMIVTSAFIRTHLGDAGGSLPLLVIFLVPFAVSIGPSFYHSLPACAPPDSSSRKILQFSSLARARLMAVKIQLIEIYDRIHFISSMPRQGCPTLP
jgi:hypothetical protein